jgi:hypothetical protein
MLKGKRSLLVGWLDAPSALPRGMARKLASHTSRRTIPSNGLQHDAFRIFVRPSEVINGYSYSEREVYPRNEDFGYSAWSYGMKELEAANARFELIQPPGRLWPTRLT